MSTSRDRRVDAEIVRGKRRLLIEIENDAAAGDVYAGLGRLLIYAKLLPRSAGYRPVLWLPSLPPKPLADVLAG